MLGPIALFAALCTALFAAAAPADDSGTWQHPLIQRAGKMHFLPDAAFIPASAVVYEAVFDVTAGASDPKQFGEGLHDVARCRRFSPTPNTRNGSISITRISSLSTSSRRPACSSWPADRR